MSQLSDPTTGLARSSTMPERDLISLDGEWNFRHDSDDAQHVRKAHVPAPWQANFKDLCVSFGTGTYWRSFDRPNIAEGQRVFLCFGAVNDRALVRVNGLDVASHEGGYIPFEFELDPNTLRASNELEVVATLPGSAPLEDGDDFTQIPHGKQSWYGPQGGIWQSVWLEVRSSAHIQNVRFDPKFPSGDLSAHVEISGRAATVKLDLFDADGNLCGSVQAAAEGEQVDMSVSVENPSPWSPETPTLYEARVSVLDSAGAILDQLTQNIGFRSIEAKDGLIYLNGSPLYIRSALDQDYYPDGFGTPPSLELLEDQARKAKAMGLNCLRIHIKVPDPRYYDVADRLGLLIWTEIPNVDTLTTRSAERLQQTMKEILRRDRNHPSIIAWTLINEDWGTRLVDVKSQRVWLSDFVEWMRKEDPLRLIVDNSACFANFHVNTDINDFHFYRSAIDNRMEWDLLTKEFANNADWTFGSDDSVTRTGKEPLILSEFGVWGLPHPAKLKDQDGHEPWWMPMAASWADGTVYPSQIEARFDELGLQCVFGSFDQFIEDVQWFQFTHLKYEIEEIRAYAEISGYVITEFTDAHWEGNGLLDMQRNPRVFAQALSNIQRDIVISPRAEKFSAYAGDKMGFDLRVSTGGAQIPEGAHLTWKFGAGSGSVAISAAGQMQSLAHVIEAEAPAAARNSTEQITFELVTENGEKLAENSETLSIYAPRTAPKNLAQDLKLYSDNADMAERLSAWGFEMADLASADLCVTDYLDSDKVQRIFDGKRTLQLVPHDAKSLRSDPPMRDGPWSINIDDGLPGTRSGANTVFPGCGITHRHHTIWRGDWVGTFSWLNRNGHFGHVPGGPLFDMSFGEVTPTHIFTNMRPWQYHGQVHAGAVVGWVQKPAGFIYEKRLGSAKYVGSTFNLMQASAEHSPLAHALIDGLVNLTMDK